MDISESCIGGYSVVRWGKSDGCGKRCDIPVSIQWSIPWSSESYKLPAAFQTNRTNIAADYAQCTFGGCKYCMLFILNSLGILSRHWKLF